MGPLEKKMVNKLRYSSYSIVLRNIYYSFYIYIYIYILVLILTYVFNYLFLNIYTILILNDKFFLSYLGLKSQNPDFVPIT